MTALEFTRRWTLHVLPAGFTKTRHYGGWSNRRREAYLDQCARLPDAAGVPLAEHAHQFDPWRDDEARKCKPRSWNTVHGWTKIGERLRVQIGRALAATPRTRGLFGARTLPNRVKTW